MDPETFEQTHRERPACSATLLPFLQDNMTVTVDLVENEPVGVRLPSTVILEVTEADPVVKGQTADQQLQARHAQQRREDPGAPFRREPASASSSSTEDASYVERFEGLRPRGNLPWPSASPPT